MSFSLAYNVSQKMSSLVHFVKKSQSSDTFWKNESSVSQKKLKMTKVGKIIASQHKNWKISMTTKGKCKIRDGRACIFCRADHVKQVSGESFLQERHKTRYSESDHISWRTRTHTFSRVVWPIPSHLTPWNAKPPGARDGAQARRPRSWGFATNCVSRNGP